MSLWAGGAMASDNEDADATVSLRAAMAIARSRAPRCERLAFLRRTHARVLELPGGVLHLTDHYGITSLVILGDAGDPRLGW